jgi:hypothetical protein
LSGRYGVDDIPFGKVDIALVEAYACYLKTDLNLSPRTVKSNMIPFRTVVLAFRIHSRNAGIFRLWLMKRVSYRQSPVMQRLTDERKISLN